MQFDHAVTLVGRALENGLQEQHNIGDKDNPKWESKYTLNQMLEDEFRFPPPPKPPTVQEQQMSAINVLRGWARMTSAVRDIKAK